MRIVPLILTLFADHVLATSPKPVVTQEQITLSSQEDGFCHRGDHSPEVHLDNATFTGFCFGSTARFLGIPFAQPPTGNRRLRVPEPLPPYEGNYEASKYGPSCPQQRFVIPQLNEHEYVEREVTNIVAKMYDDFTPDSEDCLTINVITPEHATEASNLPVVVWIFGGGFEIGGTAIYHGWSIVSRSIEIGEPIIFVSMNYRVSAFGFLPGKEVKDAKIGNLGLQDQRLALKWVQQYISAFGGDPSKVTIWGESAGAISVALHMLVNKGDQEGLFRGAIMQSGGPIPVGDIKNGQEHYDELVKNAGCDTSADTLECLRTIPYARFKYAMDLSPDFFAYRGLALAWLPRVDGVFLTEPPQHAVLRGHVANVPMITGNCDDEGSLFSLSSLNITTTAEVGQYFKSFMIPTASKKEVDDLLQYYPEDPEAGCPFDTERRNMLSQSYKRISAIQGDIVFHGPRRLLLKYRANKQDSWAFIHKRFKYLPFVGAAHGTDLVNSFGRGDLVDYIIYFTQNLDPNGNQPIRWPKYDLQDPKALIFQDDPLFPLVIGNDDYRINPLNFAVNLSLLHPI